MKKRRKNTEEEKQFDDVEVNESDLYFSDDDDLELEEEELDSFEDEEDDLELEEEELDSFEDEEDDLELEEEDSDSFEEEDFDNEKGEVDRGIVGSRLGDVVSELKIADFLVKDLHPSISKTIKKTVTAGVVSIVNSKKNGKRFLLSNEVHDMIGAPESVQIGYKQNQIIISEYIADNFSFYGLKKHGSKRIIYSKELVEQITDFYELDFRKKTCITFSKATYESLNDSIIAVIDVN